MELKCLLLFLNDVDNTLSRVVFFFTVNVSPRNIKFLFVRTTDKMSSHLVFLSRIFRYITLKTFFLYIIPHLPCRNTCVLIDVFMRIKIDNKFHR